MNMDVYGNNKDELITLPPYVATISRNRWAIVSRHLSLGTTRHTRTAPDHLSLIAYMFRETGPISSACELSFSCPSALSSRIGPSDWRCPLRILSLLPGNLRLPPSGSSNPRTRRMEALDSVKTLRTGAHHRNAYRGRGVPARMSCSRTRFVPCMPNRSSCVALMMT
jgi:hypothetical protein